MAVTLTRIAAAGPPRDLGAALGRAGRDATHRFLVEHPLWKRVNAPEHAEAVSRMARATRDRFPWVWAEFEGMAEALEVPLNHLFAWNCRGDLLAKAPDGCTTVLLPAHSGQAITLAHNEDGFPFLDGHCLLANLRPEGQPDLVTFAYPASIPGHTFAVSGAGLVQTVNNIRLTGVQPTIPRMVLGRAVLSCRALDQAVGLLRAGADSGGFHFGLAQAGDPRLLSVEFGRGAVSVQEILEPSAHANHALHHPAIEGQQIVTRSSADRQQRADDLVRRGRDPLMVLGDKATGRLPIRREDADDPDEENTMATLMARVSTTAVDWEVHSHPGSPPAFSGTIPASREG